MKEKLILFFSDPMHVFFTSVFLFFLAHFSLLYYAPMGVSLLVMLWPGKIEGTRKLFHQFSIALLCLAFAIYGYYYMTINYYVAQGDLLSIRVATALGVPNSMNLVFSNGYTALHYFAYHGNREMVEFILENGMAVDIQSHGHLPFTPFYLAVQANQMEMAEFLLSKGAKVKAGNAEGSAIHVAAQLGNIEMMKFLIKNGANVNEANSFGETPLWYATHYNQPAMQEFLRNKGAH